MSDRGVAIIGGAGFIGSALVRCFQSQGVNYEIYDISSKSVAEPSVNFLDVRNIDQGSIFKGHSCLVNLAAEHRDDVRPISRYDDVNVKGAENVCAAASRSDVKTIVFTSSVAVYGFAPEDTDEAGQINYFNDYGRTKYLAEVVYRRWQQEDPKNRTLVIIRPTVVFGEGNRGNVFNLCQSISAGRFLMIGSGENVKSMAYVDNVADFISYSLNFGPGAHVYNYVDKPDLDMNTLVATVKRLLFGRTTVGVRLPVSVGLALGLLADALSRVLGVSLPVSAVRVRKFIATTKFASAVSETNFEASVSLEEGLSRTIRHDFLDG